MPTLNEKITYWAPGSENQFGGKSYGAPIILRGRWEDKVENIISHDGQQIVSRSRIFTDKPIQPTGYLMHGESEAADPVALPEALEIRNVGSIPNLSNLARLWTAYI